MIPVSLLIFDLDGTLVDTLDDITASVNHVLTALGREPLGRDRVRRFVGDGVRTLLVRAMEGDETRIEEALPLYREHHARNLTTHSKLYPGVRETLEHFQELPLAVISNKTIDFIEPLLGALGVERYFSKVIGAGQGIALKPAPDAIVRILSELHAPRERTVMVGDGTTDMRAGRAAGVITCAATWGFRSEAELQQESPDHRIHDMRELMQLFAPRRTS